MTEIGIAIAGQVITGVVLVATIRVKLENLTGWVKSIDAQAKSTHDIALTTQTRVQDLPCRNCDLSGD